MAQITNIENYLNINRLRKNTQNSPTKEKSTTDRKTNQKITDNSSSTPAHIEILRKHIKDTSEPKITDVSDAHQITSKIKEDILKNSDQGNPIHKDINRERVKQLLK